MLTIMMIIFAFIAHDFFNLNAHYLLDVSREYGLFDCFHISHKVTQLYRHSV